MLNPEQMAAGGTIAGLRDATFLVALGIITPLCYVLWFSFCLILLILRLDNHFGFKTPFIFFDLSTACVLFIPVMWIWFFFVSLFLQLRQMSRFIIDSTIAFEALWLLGIFAILFILMVAIFLRGYLLMVYHCDVDSNSVQGKAQYYRSMLLCFTTSVFTAIVIVYI